MYKYFRTEVIIQFIKFCIVGFINTCIDIGIYFVLTRYAHLPILLANTISFSTAVVNSYFLNKLWTFNDKGKANPRQFVKFLGVSIIGLGINDAVVVILVKFGLFDLFAKVGAVGISLVWNFIANKFFTFKEKAQ